MSGLAYGGRTVGQNDEIIIPEKKPSDKITVGREEPVVDEAGAPIVRDASLPKVVFTDQDKDNPAQPTGLEDNR